MEAVIDHPCSALVWNNHRGIWKFVALDQVVASLVDCIERRRDLVTVPSSNGMVAKTCGLLRRLIERIGFEPSKVAEAVRLTNTRKTS
ncbi:hypothetical protein [Pseudomonas sp. MSSRFD41]|nr:hypothetical protein [Pseudomonas sp. MSSRFD41]